MYTAHSNSKSKRGRTASIVKAGYSLYILWAVHEIDEWGQLEFEQRPIGATSPTRAGITPSLHGVIVIPPIEEP